MEAWLLSGLDAFRKQGQFHDGFYLNVVWMGVSKVKAYNGKSLLLAGRGWVCISLVCTVTFSLCFNEIMS